MVYTQEIKPCNMFLKEIGLVDAGYAYLIGIFVSSTKIFKPKIHLAMDVLQTIDSLWKENETISFTKRQCFQDKYRSADKLFFRMGRLMPIDLLQCKHG